MVGETLNSIKDYLLERVSSPFFGAFASIWAFRNWESILVVFSDLNVQRKINIIKTFHLDTLTDWWTPLWVSILLIVLYPIFSHGAKLVWHYFRVKANDILLDKIEKGAAADKTVVEGLRARVKQLQLELSEAQQTETELRTVINELNERQNGKDTSVANEGIQNNIETNDKGKNSTNISGRVLEANTPELDGILSELDVNKKKLWNENYNQFINYNKKVAFSALVEFCQDPSNSSMAPSYILTLSQANYVVNFKNKTMPTIEAYYIIKFVLQESCTGDIYVPNEL